MKLHNINQHSKIALSRAMSRFADYRSSATDLEKRCYKTSDTILLTFDDYGSEDEIKDILMILSDKKVKAAFFIQGDWVEKNQQLVNIIRQAGHVLGNHTYSHRDLRKLSEDAIIEQVRKGLPGPWFRPPQGRYNDRVRQIVHKLGYVICYWSIDSRDWTGMSKNGMRYRILAGLHPGAVILLHMHGKNTRQLLPELIDEIRVRGYKLCDPKETWKP